VISTKQLIKRHYKQFIMLGVDFTLLSAALLFALWTRLGDIWLPVRMQQYSVLVLSLALSLFAFMRLGLYRSIIRYMGQQAIFAVMQGVSLSALIIAVASFMSDEFMPRSVPIIYWCFAYVFIGGSRIAIRAFYHKGLEIQKERVAIYGAGTSGLQVYKALMHGKDHKPIIFLDDNAGKQGMILDGLPVQGTQNIPRILQRYGITKILLAMPSVSLHRRREIMRDLEAQGIATQMVPGIEDLLNSSLRGSDVSSVYDDILGRPPVAPDQALLHQCIENRVVMVTGAAGSIGSELCRQILLNHPRQLLLLDINEYGLYKMEQELQQVELLEGLRSTEVISLLGNVTDQRRMAQIMKTFSVQTIYHAAAYKHVPIVENNMVEGVRNNVIGTWSLVRAAAEAAVETFVLISTDKAVRPVSIMGASKRCAELICQAYARSDVPTRFCMVRFGNVLGSSGSVVPLFFDQINGGGPVTVTHPEVTRYFMTISEAAQLVLQAGSMGRGGEVFVLDMGKPVKIMDLAERMVSLLGHSLRNEENPDGDIEIRVTGLRPGEKLFEELILGDNITGTGHPMIMQADENYLELVNLLACLEQIELVCQEGDCRSIKNLLIEIVGDFPENPINDIVWLHSQADRNDGIVSSGRDNVTPLLRRPPKT
jgi:FlaA1/EpsC-like NDP-sugar epimerase